MYAGRPAYIEQLNDISFWLPILERIKMRTPKTKIFMTSDEVGEVIDGAESVPAFESLVEDVTKAAAALGDSQGRSFLRTGQTSNKHEWAGTCFIDFKKSKIAQQIASLIEFSMMVDLPYTTWAVREFIETDPVTTSFRGMPIAREVRVFAQNGEIICMHPYWPQEAFENQRKAPTADELAKLHLMPAGDELTELEAMAKYVSKHFVGAWSIDFLQDKKDNWWLTDMALAGCSYHWPDCPHKNEIKEL